MNYFNRKLTFWYEEACREKGIRARPMNKNFAIFPKSFYKRAAELPQAKTIDFIFIGSFAFPPPQKYQEVGLRNRKWTIPFAKKHFTAKSYFVNTTKHRHLKKKWVALGNFDNTFKVKNPLVPKYDDKNRHKFDAEYFRKMCASKFCLCPGGDKIWSMRFYEAIMCKCIPIVRVREESFRSVEESKLTYKFYYSNETFVYRQDWVDHNYKIFLKYHTFEEK